MLRPLIVTRDEHVERLPVHLALHQGRGECRVERLHHGGSRAQQLLDLFGGGAAGLRRQAVPRLDVHRVSDVHDDLAGELVGLLPDRVLDTRIVDGEDQGWRR
jgi:hypothetical protein